MTTPDNPDPQLETRANIETGAMMYRVAGSFMPWQFRQELAIETWRKVQAYQAKREGK